MLRLLRWLPSHFAAAIALLATSVNAAERPNVVILLSDDQAWTDYGFMGHPTIKTPHLDKLSTESATFINGYVPTSLCRPSLVTLISGLYPHEHKITGNDPPTKQTDRREMLRHIHRIPKLPALLGEAGYVSFQTGKWWEGNYKDGGFSAGMTQGDPAHRGRHGDEGLKIGRDGLDPIWTFLDENKGKPFFLWYAPMMPHQPHTPPERLLTKYQSPDRPIELAKYYAMCEWYDETCGALLDGLERRGLAGNTLVVSFADNGWIQKTPESHLPPDWKQPFAPKSKRSPYDGGLRTPIMLRWPGKIKPAKCETLVSSIDLAPTILHACGVTPPAEMTGINLLDVIAAEGKADRDTIFGAIYEHDEPDIDDPAAGLLFRWCRHQNLKLIEPATAGGKPELYDLTTDPHEEQDLAGTEPDKVAELKKRIDEWWTPGDKK
jgi:uncharacterized sulfatase